MFLHTPGRFVTHPSLEPARRGRWQRWSAFAHSWLFAVGAGRDARQHPHADGVEQSLWTRQASVDFRGDGGYVIAPPPRVMLGPDQVGTYELRATSSGPPQPADAVALRALLLPERYPQMADDGR